MHKWLRKWAYSIIEKDLKKLPPLSSISSRGDAFLLRIQYGPLRGDSTTRQSEKLLGLVDSYFVQEGIK